MVESGKEAIRYVLFFAKPTSQFSPFFVLRGPVLSPP